MTDYLKVNGVQVPVAYGSSPTRTRVYCGGRGTRAYNGAPRNNAHANLFDWKGRTALQAASLSESFRALVEGEGQVWGFDNASPLAMAGSRGDVATLFGDAELEAGTRGFGGSQVICVDEGGVDFGFPLTGEQWTVMFWNNTSSIPTWRHWIFRGDGSTWTNGGAPATVPFFFNDVPTFQLLAVAGDTFTRFDGVVYLPFQIPDDWAAQLYAFHVDHTFPALPYVGIGGRCIQGTQTLVSLGEVTDMQQTDVGALHESFDFMIRQVP